MRGPVPDLQWIARLQLSKELLLAFPKKSSGVFVPISCKLKPITFAAIIMKTKTLHRDKVNIITLGCSKNMVDSEVLSGQLLANEIDTVHESGKKRPQYCNCEHLRLY